MPLCCAAQHCDYHAQIFYGRGSGGTRYGNCYDSTGCPDKTGWSPDNRFTGNEKLGATGYSTSLYTIPEFEYTREVFNRTVARALADNVSDVIPFICLGCGYRRYTRTMAEHTGSTAGGGQDWTYDSEWDYDRVYSWMLGAELNRPWYSEGGRAQRYALWSMAKSVVLYPSVFASPALARGLNSTHYMGECYCFSYSFTCGAHIGHWIVPL